MSVTERVLAARSQVRRAQAAVERYANAQKKARNAKDAKGAGLDRTLLLQAVEQVKPKVVRYLLANYDRSGLKHETGRLRDAIARSEVGLGGSARKPYLYIAFPAGLPDNKKTKDHTKKSVYVYGASLNFGAVYVPRVNRLVRDYPTGKTYMAVRPILGQRAKKSIKKAAFDEVYRHKVDAHLAKHGIKARPNYFTDMGKTIVGPKVRIVKPRRYFHLNTAQQADVLKDVATNYQRLKSQAAARN